MKMESTGLQKLVQASQTSSTIMLGEELPHQTLGEVLEKIHPFLLDDRNHSKVIDTLHELSSIVNECDAAWLMSQGNDDSTHVLELCERVSDSTAGDRKFEGREDASFTPDDFLYCADKAQVGMNIFISVLRKLVTLDIPKKKMEEICQHMFPLIIEHFTPGMWTSEDSNIISRLHSKQKNSLH